MFNTQNTWRGSGANEKALRTLLRAQSCFLNGKEIPLIHYVTGNTQKKRSPKGADLLKLLFQYMTQQFPAGETITVKLATSSWICSVSTKACQ